MAEVTQGLAQMITKIKQECDLDPAGNAPDTLKAAATFLGMSPSGTPKDQAFAICKKLTLTLAPEPVAPRAASTAAAPDPPRQDPARVADAPPPAEEVPPRVEIAEEDPLPPQSPAEEALDPPTDRAEEPASASPNFVRGNTVADKPALVGKRVKMQTQRSCNGQEGVVVKYHGMDVLPGRKGKTQQRDRFDVRLDSGQTIEMTAAGTFLVFVDAPVQVPVRVAAAPLLLMPPPTVEAAPRAVAPAAAFEMPPPPPRAQSETSEEAEPEDFVGSLVRLFRFQGSQVGLNGKTGKVAKYRGFLGPRRKMTHRYDIILDSGEKLPSVALGNLFELHADEEEEDDDAASTVAQRSERAAEEEEDVAAPTVADENPPHSVQEWQGDPEFVKFITDRDLPLVQNLRNRANSVREFFVLGGSEDELTRALGDGDCEIDYYGELFPAWREYMKPPASCFTSTKRARDDDREADGPARQKPAHALFD